MSSRSAPSAPAGAQPTTPLPTRRGASTRCRCHCLRRDADIPQPTLSRDRPRPATVRDAPSTPCTGEDCIPQPTTPPPSTGPQQPGDGSGDGDSDCGITDIGACITEAINAVFRGIVEAALSPILELIGHTALSTPTISDLPGIGELWNNSWEIVVAAYGLLILIGGIVVMGHESVQTRYSIKEIGPRIPVAFLASALSLFFADKLIRLANGLTLGVLGDGVERALAGQHPRGRRPGHRDRWAVHHPGRPGPRRGGPRPAGRLRGPDRHHPDPDHRRAAVPDVPRPAAHRPAGPLVVEGDHRDARPSRSRRRWC